MDEGRSPTAPLKGSRTPGKQPGGLFSVSVGRQAPGCWLRRQAQTEGCNLLRNAAAGAVTTAAACIPLLQCTSFHNNSFGDHLFPRIAFTKLKRKDRNYGTV